MRLTFCKTQSVGLLATGTVLTERVVDGAAEGGQVTLYMECHKLSTCGQRGGGSKCVRAFSVDAQ